MTFAESKAYAASRGNRLPTVDEVKLILSHNKGKPLVEEHVYVHATKSNDADTTIYIGNQ